MNTKLFLALSLAGGLGATSAGLRFGEALAGSSYEKTLARPVDRSVDATLLVTLSEGAEPEAHVLAGGHIRKVVAGGRPHPYRKARAGGHIRKVLAGVVATSTLGR